MTSQLAKELMEDLLQEETNPTEFFATSRLDKESDYSEDEAESPWMGTDMCEAGKFKNKKTIENLCPSLPGGEELCAVGPQSHHHQVLPRNEEASSLHRVCGQCQERTPSAFVAGEERDAAKKGREANSNDSQSQEQESFHSKGQQRGERGSHPTGGWIQQFDKEAGMDQEEEWNSEVNSDSEAVASASAQPKTRPYKSK